MDEQFQNNSSNNTECRVQSEENGENKNTQDNTLIHSNAKDYTDSINQAVPPAQKAYSMGEPLPKRLKESFEADRTDSIFAVLIFALGFLFVQWVLFTWQGWGVAVFTVIYCGSVTTYLLKKGVHFSRAGWFYLGVLVLTGGSFALWKGNSLEPIRSLFLLCLAVYWVVSATGVPLLGKTSNFLVLDGLNGFFVIPFSNFGCQYKSLALLRRKKEKTGSPLWSIALGLLFAIIVGIIVLPLLMEADSGGFSKIAQGMLDYLRGLQSNVWQLFLHAALAIPVSAYLYGLIAGCAHKRNCNVLSKEGAQKTVSALRVLPPATVYTLLFLICCLYILFIGSQLTYFFSAFSGVRPAGWQVFSEYARRGFFELCSISAINLTLLTAANLFCKKPRQDSAALKIFNGLLSLLTLLLIGTAFSKMALYIGAYGLSVMRLLPCVFMVFLAVLCLGILALQKWEFSIARLAAGVGAVMLCVLCLSDPDGLVSRYNANRYLSGTLNSFDVEIVRRAGPAGVEPALKVYAQTGDVALKTNLKEYLIAISQQIKSQEQSGLRDTLQNAAVRQKTAEFAALNGVE